MNKTMERIKKEMDEFDGTKLAYSDEEKKIVLMLMYACSIKI